MITLVEPTLIRLDGYDQNPRNSRLKNMLTYIDQKVDYEIKKHKKSQWFLQKYGAEKWQERLDELKAQRTKCLLGDDMSAPSGLADQIARFFDDNIVNEVTYPNPDRIPWDNVPKHPNRYYQDLMEEKLISAKHAAVEVGTGLGKSTSIRNLTKHYGLRTVVMTPSVSIAGQIYKDFVHHFGRKYVGAFFDGKKDYKKKFVVAVAASLTRVEQDSEAWQYLSQTQVFIADESHLCPAKTLSTVCFGLLKNAPYRFFFSGTQVRNDGLDLLLDGITGPVVYRKTVREGVDEGFLAKPVFTMLDTYSAKGFNSQDPNEMTREHLYYNPAVNQIAGDIANKFVSFLKHPVLILVEEVEQIAHLLPFLRHEVGFAHGGLTKENKGGVPEQFHKSDPDELVKRFNEKKLPILVGTSCIATGTDIQSARTMIYLRGGKSEIEVKQSVGRCTRLFEDKKECNVFDFNVSNVPILKRHAQARMELYNEIYGPVEETVWK